jgi:hypothetical protein
MLSAQDVPSASAHTLHKIHPLTMATISHTELLLDLGVFLMEYSNNGNHSNKVHVNHSTGVTCLQHDNIPQGLILQYALPTFSLKLLSNSSFFLYFLMNYD